MFLQIKRSFLVAGMIYLITYPVLAATVEENFKLASEAYSQGKFEEAGDLFGEVAKALAKKDPNRAALFWGNAGYAKLQGKNLEKAADFFNKAIELGKKLPKEQLEPIYQNLTSCLAKLNRRAEEIKVVEAMEKALKPKGELAAGLKASAGDAYRNLELHPLAVASYQDALQKLPKNSNQEQRALILTAMGLSQILLGSFDEAEKNLSLANELATKLGKPQTIAESFENLGILQWQKGAYQNAIEYLNKALQVERKEKLLRNEGVDTNNLGLVKKAMGNLDEAMQCFKKALEIANEVGNKKDAGIAIVNIALMYRISGDYNNAEIYYEDAKNIFEEVDFKEGLAGVYLGIGKMTELGSRNYQQAEKNYKKALEIYTKLGLIRGRAETLIALGAMLKKQSDKTRATRDLVFEDDEDESIATVDNKSSSNQVISSYFNSKSNNIEENALSEEKSNVALTSGLNQKISELRNIASEALKIAESIDSREFIWSAHQLLGFSDLKEGKLESSFEHYEKAIDIVTKQYTDSSSVEMMGEYMAGKEDLFNEAEEVVGLLYDKTKDQKYANLLVIYSDTLRNEIQKASASQAQIRFIEPKKQELFEKLNELGKAQKLAELSMPSVAEITNNSSIEDKAKHELSAKALKDQKVKVEKLGKDYDKLYSEWKERYKGDALMFESSSRVNAKELQQNVKDDEIIIQYTVLPEKVLITTIDPKNIAVVSVDVKQSELNKLYSKDFINDYILTYGRGDVEPCGGDWQKCLVKCNKTLSKFYSYLINPVKEYLNGKKKIYIVADSVLSSIPFSALVINNDYDNAEYLVEKYDVAYLRPAFANALLKHEGKNSEKRMLAVGNAFNVFFNMAVLDGTRDEIQTASQTLSPDGSDVDVALETIKTGSITSANGKERKNVDRHFISAPLSETELSDKYAYLFKKMPIPRPTESWLRQQLSEHKYEFLYFATHGMPSSNWLMSVKNQYKPAFEKNVNNPKKKSEISYLTSVFEEIDKNLNNPKNSPLTGFLYLSSNATEFGTSAKELKSEEDGLLTIKEILELPDSIWETTKYVILSACNTGVTYNPDAVVATEDDVKDLISFDDAENQKELRKLGWLPGIDQVSFVDTFMRRGVLDVYGNFWFADDAASSFILSNTMKNVGSQTKVDMVSALCNAQRFYIEQSKQGKGPYKTPEDVHPYFWAVGGIFGK